VISGRCYQASLQKKPEGFNSGWNDRKGIGHRA